MDMNETIFEYNFSNFQVKSLRYNKTTLNELLNGNSSSIKISNHSSAAFYNHDYISQLSNAGK